MPTVALRGGSLDAEAALLCLDAAWGNARLPFRNRSLEYTEWPNLSARPLSLWRLVDGVLCCRCHFLITHAVLLYDCC